MPGCAATFRAESEEELLQQVGLHAADVHGLSEVTPVVLEAVKGGDQAVLRRSGRSPLTSEGGGDGARIAPLRIGRDTHLLRDVGEVQSAGLWVCVNSMVITGAEPVIAATGADRGQWLEDVFGVVEATDVRCVYVSLDDLYNAGAHSLLITDTGIDHAFRLLREVPATPAPPWHLMTDLTAEKGRDR